jgi:hypothetical protein
VREPQHAAALLARQAAAAQRVERVDRLAALV